MVNTYWFVIFLLGIFSHVKEEILVKSIYETTSLEFKTEQSQIVLKTIVLISSFYFKTELK